MTRLRIATVGVGPAAGTRASLHLDTISRMHDRYELCALCDRNPDRLEQAGEQFGVDARYTDLQQMLREAKPDVVYRLTPMDSIVPVCMTIAEAGAHLINEIPIAPTLATADAIIDACRRNNVKLEVAENVWCWPQELLKAKIARDGALGELTHGRLLYPCGTYHGLSTVRRIIGGDPVRALGFDGKVPVRPKPSYNGETMRECAWEAGVFEFAGGMRVLYEMPPADCTRPAHWRIEGVNGHLDGDKLVLYDGETGVEYPFIYEYDDADKRVIKRVYVDTTPRIEWENPYAPYGIGDKDAIARARILTSMHEAVTRDAEPHYGGADARMDMEAWIALRESAWRDSTWIDLPLTEETGVERALREAFEARYGGDPVRDAAKLLNTRFPRGGVPWDVLGWL